ncbi:MAG: BadF/BadG/BcrA/BcrD ATPase family protein [Lapillicoccus sp.]
MSTTAPSRTGMPGVCAASSERPAMTGVRDQSPSAPGLLVLGVDIGGTSVRAQVSDLAGVRLGLGRAPGGNPNAVGMDAALAHIRMALEDALAPVDRAKIGAAVVGAAGFGHEQGPGQAFLDMWAASGVPVAPSVVSDPLVAFAAGTDGRTGTVVVSGTGAAAVAISDLDVDLVADGNGWMIGDDGSGYWVGREAVRHAVRPWRGIPDDPLTLAVTTHLLGGPATRQDLIHHLYAGSPIRLTTLAPVVVAAGEAGDPDARRILEGAAALLERSTASVRPEGATTPVVLGGGMFASALLRMALTDRLQTRWPDAQVVQATNAVGGAAWLAALVVDPSSPPSLHAALVAD